MKVEDKIASAGFIPKPEIYRLSITKIFCLAHFLRCAGQSKNNMPEQFQEDYKENIERPFVERELEKEQHEDDNA